MDRNRISASRLLMCAAIGAASWIVPPPAGMQLAGWHVLGVFAAIIAGFLLRPLPMGAAVLIALILLAGTGALEVETVLSGFGDHTVWLVVAAFLLAGAVERSGFGRRIALTLVALMGRSTVGLGYAICGAELILGPIVPSNTARGGGIMAPIVRSFAIVLGSTPSNAPERAGRYLLTLGAHANLVTAAMFLTGMAANPLVAKAAADVFGIEFSWATWALGAAIPGLASLALLPLVIYRLERPTLGDATPARDQARADLNAMGAWKHSEKLMAIVFALLLALWSTKPLHGIDAGVVALAGVCVLILARTETWDDVIGNAAAWDTLVWLGGLLAMANALKDTGVVGWFADTMQSHVVGLTGVGLVVVLGLVYFYSMYGFSMLTAHISAFVAAFFAVAAAAGAPPMLTIAVLAYFSNLCACTTNYSTGPVIIYFGYGYVPAPAWFRTGAVMSLVFLTVWLGIGLAWWKLLGWW
jgi:DASS family divalent anion:Na+ symporter